MRLDKFLAHHLEISRSLVNKELKSGYVTVEGHKVNSGSYQVTENSIVCYRGIRITPITDKRYFMVNKPMGYVCARDDHENPTILSLINEPIPQTLHAAGRLDKETTGMVLLTDDGQWSHRITSPKHQHEKEYHVHTSEPISPQTIDQFAKGLMLKGERIATKPAKLIIHSDYDATVLLSEGRYHQVRRMFAATGNHVMTLHRHRIGTLILDIPEGQYRALTSEEINAFHASVISKK